MVDAFTQVPPDSTGDKIDTTELTVNAQTVQRQRMVIAGAADVDLCPVSATAGQKVNLGADNDITFASEHTRNLAFVESVAIGGEFDDTAPVAATEGNVSPVRITAQRGMHVNLRNAAGVEFPSGGGVEADALRVTIANDSTGILTIDLDDTIDANNSTTTPLGISATFTGTGTNVIGYTSVTVQLVADEASATAGLRIEFSEDNTNWDFSHQFEFLANVSREFHFGVHGQFFRVVFVNGTTAQTFFRLQAILHRGSQAQEIHRLDEDLAPDHPAYAVRAAIVAQAAGAGNFVAVQATSGGNLKFSLEEVDVGVTVPISAVSLPLPTGAATSALQLVNGHDVTVDNASGGAAVNIQDGGNVITVDGTVTANAGTGDRLLITGHLINEAFKEAGAIAGQLDDTATTAATENGIAPVRITAQRGLHVNLRDNAGAELGTTGNPVRITDDGTAVLVDGSAVTQPISAASLPLPTGAATSALQLAADHLVDLASEHVRNDVFVESVAIGGELDDTAPVVATEGDVSPVRITAQRGMHVNLRNNAGTELGTTGNPVIITDDGTALLVDGSAVTQPVSGTVTANAGTGTLLVDLAGNNDVTTTGNVANDVADAGNPMKIGHKAREFGTDPTTVNANNDRVDSIATPQGMQWVLGGHPNIITREYMTTAVQANDDMIAAVAPGSHIVLTKIAAVTDVATTGDPQVRIGFGATVVPAEPASGASIAGVVLSHGGIAAGSGVSLGDGSGMIAVGGDGEELRITCQVPTGGKITVVFSYYITTL